MIATVWHQAGVQVRPDTVPDLLGHVANLTVATGHRYVWRGVTDVRYKMDTSIARRFQASNLPLTAKTMASYEASLIKAARDARLDQGLSDAELLALLQHAGAATSLLDITPDPYVALFFATEPTTDPPVPSALMAIRVPGTSAARQAARTFKGPLPDDGSGKPVYERLAAERRLKPSTLPILWEAPFVDNRMRAQRGMFLATPAGKPLTYGSVNLQLASAATEALSVDHLLRRDRGRYRRPPLIVFYISAAMREKVRSELDLRFGYRTDTIYPDLQGFARANAWNRNLG
jgi:hypothetical protein